MDNIIVINSMPQKQNLNYRDPLTNNNILITILSGAQVILPGSENWTVEQMAKVTRFFDELGYPEKSSMDRGLKKFSGVMYSIKNPATIEKIHQANEDYLQHRNDVSVSEATKAARAFDLTTRDKESGKRLASTTGVEVIKANNGKLQPEEMHMNIEVSPEGAPDNQVLPR